MRLNFGPDQAATLHCWLFMSPNMKKPAPVFLVDNFKYTRFAEELALSRERSPSACITPAIPPISSTCRRM